jgi:hypothetical protein
MVVSIAVALEGVGVCMMDQSVNHPSAQWDFQLWMFGGVPESRVVDAARCISGFLSCRRHTTQPCYTIAVEASPGVQKLLATILELAGGFGLTCWQLTVKRATVILEEEPRQVATN